MFGGWTALRIGRWKEAMTNVQWERWSKVLKLDLAQNGDIESLQCSHLQLQALLESVHACAYNQPHETGYDGG